MGILAQWRIGARLAVGYALMIVLMVVALAATWFNLDRIRQANDTLQHVQSERLALAREWHENIVANSTRAMAMALDETGMVDQYFAEAARAVTDRTTVIQRRYAEIETTETGRRIAQQLGEVRQRYLSRREALLQSGTSEGLQARAAAFQSVVKDYVATADAMVAYQIQRQTELGQAVDHRVEQAEWIFVLLTAFNVIVAGLVGWGVTRSIVRPLASLREVARRIAAGHLESPVIVRGRSELADLAVSINAMQDALRDLVGQVRHASVAIRQASQEVASGNLDLSHRTEQAAGSLQSTASSMEQIAVTLRHSAEVATQADALAAGARDVADRGGQVMDEVVRTMGQIHAASAKIGDIIGVIDGIAFQTSILALNAAVEAARAGEQGRGFAVVASEVRSLAGRSAEAAREVKVLIGDSVDKVERGRASVGSAGTTMVEIVTSVERVTGLIGEIKVAAGEQSCGVDQINSAVVQLDQMTQQNAALVEQSAAAARSLQEEASRLHALVERFQV